jgi:hypothetical protein
VCSAKIIREQHILREERINELLDLVKVTELDSNNGGVCHDNKS